MKLAPHCERKIETRQSGLLVDVVFAAVPPARCEHRDQTKFRLRPVKRKVSWLNCTYVSRDLLSPELTHISPSTQDDTSTDAQLALALSLEDSLPPDDAEVDPFYELLVPAQTVIVRAYADDSDDRLLAELQPRFIVMYEPNQDFIRRIEVRIMSNLTKGYLNWMRRYTRHQILGLGSAFIS